MSEFQSFLVPYDFSAHARAALSLAIDLARRLGADLHLVHVTQTPAYAYGYGTHAGAVVPPIDMRTVNEGAMKHLQEVVDACAEDLPGKFEPHVIEGAGVASMLCDLAQQLEADLIVMGTHGRTGLAHVFLGSVAERTLRGAPCPVLTVRAGEDGTT